jgi:galactose mutarotase-like enzyme
VMQSQSSSAEVSVELLLKTRGQLLNAGLTLINLTQHSCFNMPGRGDVLGHIAQINADHFTPNDESLIATGGTERANWKLRP